MFDIKNRLQEYMPALIELLNDEKISWREINIHFNKEFEIRKQKYLDNGNYLLTSASFYDIITEKINGNKSAERLFIFINRIIEELIIEVPATLIGKLKKTIFNLLTNFDYNYLNFVAELAVLNNLLKSKIYLLEDIEFPMGNGNFIDFKLYNKTSSKSTYIEVVSIHPPHSIFSDYDKLNHFISKKINDKVNNKKKDTSVIFDFMLTPVIWASHEDLHKLYSFYKSGNKLSIKSSIEPSAYICFYNEESNYLLQRFGRVSTIFDEQEL